MTHGLGKTFTDETILNLQYGPFSLNLDESTSESNKRILAILTTYFCPKQERIVLEHLKSIEMFKVDTKSVLRAVDKLFTENNIPWTNIVSVLMDSCNVMRGSKNGLEVRIRKEKAPQLLDIDGDSCHHVHNACKKFCSPFDMWIEKMATDLHNDIKWSPDLKIILCEICEMLSLPYTIPQRFLSHRWLSCYDVSAPNIVMMDAFRVMYYGFMKKADRSLYKTPIQNILTERGVSVNGKLRVKEIWEELANKSMTDDGKNRKQRIIEKVLIMPKKTDLILSFYMSVLRLLKDFVLLFQRKTPMIHLLYDKQEELLRNFMSCFLKPETIIGKNAAKLKTLNLSQDEGQFMKQSDMFVGLAAEELLGQEKSLKEVDNFRNRAFTAYIKCAQHLQKRLPLDNTLLRSVSAIDPAARGHHLTARYLKDLRSNTRHFLTPEELEQVSLEAHTYQVDALLPDPATMEIDQWWVTVRKTGRFPALCKMVLTLLTCFHGPMVEASFNLMGDIINPRSSRMNVETFNAIQSVKYGLKSRSTTALQLFKKKDILHTKVDKKLCINMRSAAKHQKDQWAQASAAKQKRLEKVRTLVTAIPSSTTARNEIKEKEKEARIAHQKETKRKAAQRLSELAAKRIKMTK